MNEIVVTEPTVISPQEPTEAQIDPVPQQSTVEPEPYQEPESNESKLNRDIRPASSEVETSDKLIFPSQVINLYACTIKDAYPVDSPAYDDPSLRQKIYIRAANMAEAKQQMQDQYPDFKLFEIAYS